MRDQQRDEDIAKLESEQALRSLEQHGEIWTGTRVAREAGNPDSYATLHGSGPTALGLQGLTLGGSTPDASATAAIDRSGILARVATEVNGHSISGAGGVVAAHGYGEMVIHTSTHDSVTLGTLNGRAVHAAGFTTTQGTATMAVNEGAFAVANAKQEAEAKEAAADGRVQIAFTDKKTMGLQLTAGGSHGIVGAGVRGYFSRDKNYQYTTWLSPKDASPAFHNQSFMRQKLRSIGLLPALFKRPDLHQPLDTLNVGDSVVMSGQTTLTGSVAAAVSGVYVGLHASRETDQQVTVRRMSETTVRISATPKNNAAKTFAISADVPLLGSATASRSSSVGKAYIFDFDLTKPSAFRAYKAMLQRDMPAKDLKVDSSALDDTQETMRYLAEDLVLPEGVKLVSLMHRDRPKDITIAAGLTLLPNLLGEQVGMMGIRRRKGESNVIAVDEKSVIKHAEAAQETQSGFVRKGKTLSVAKLVHITKDTSVLGSVVNHEEIYLEASLKHERPSQDTRHQMLAWMNKHFNEKERNFSEEPYNLHHKYGYGLTVKRSLNDDDLKKLWLEGNIEGMPPVDFSDENKRPTDEQKAAIISAIKATITSGGIKALSRLQKVLGDGDKLQLQVAHDAMADIEKRFLKNSVKFARPMNNNTLVRELVNRINAAQKYYKSLDIAERDIREDFFAAEINEEAVRSSIASIVQKRVKAPDYLRLDGMSKAEAEALFKQLSKAQKQLFERLTAVDSTGKKRRGLATSTSFTIPKF